MTKQRTETDALGPVLIPENAVWGPQTERSRNNFPIGDERIPTRCIEALLTVKAACARANHDTGRITEEQRKGIERGIESARSQIETAFPLVVWQTGSGTQTNMNANEVIAALGSTKHCELHPNDHVNRSQSSNDVMPSVLHISVLLGIEKRLLPALERLRESFEALRDRAGKTVKCGRTHLQDATPMLFSQEVEGWIGMLEACDGQIRSSSNDLRSLAIGGTAVGTRLNAPPGYGPLVATYLSEETGTLFSASDNPFHQISARDGVSFVHGALRTLAANLIKLADDVRWLGSGPRAGLGELELPANEPGSSIMPGKVNPTQCEALTMVGYRVLGNDTTVALCTAGGQLQLNATLPLLMHACNQSVDLLADGMDSFAKRCIDGIQIQAERMETNAQNSLMLATALTPHVGYAQAANWARQAYRTERSIRDVAQESGLFGEEELDAILDPSWMAQPPESDDGP